LKIALASGVHSICEAACRVSVANSWLSKSPNNELVKAALYLDFGVDLLSILSGRDSLPSFASLDRRPMAL
jgi:hypothetical protein